MHTNMNCLDELNTNNCYRPTSSIQPISPPAYPMQGPPPPYAIPPPLYPLSSVNIIKTSEPCQSVPVPDDYIPYETLHIRDYMTCDGYVKFTTFMIWRQCSTITDTKGRVQSGYLIRCRNLPKNALTALRQAILKHSNS
ncbi:unnamed protein product [Rotaria sp. Silwood2]|nr:unnamed protein product [Rotaria sp. Silwood2]CAF4458441.1 unnamed protein product [Rotaria sp. Silwood2]